MICPIHKKYKGLRKPTTKKDCACHSYWRDYNFAARKSFRDKWIMRVYRDGHPPKEIAKLVGCTAKTVWHVIHKNRTPEQNQQAKIEHKRKVHMNFRKVKENVKTN